MFRCNLAAHRLNFRACICLTLSALSISALVWFADPAHAKWNWRKPFDKNSILFPPIPGPVPKLPFNFPGVDLPAGFGAQGELCESIDKVRLDATNLRQQFFAGIGNLPIPDDGLLLFDLHSRGSFTYNAYAGTAGYKLTLPGGMELDKTKVKASLEGKYSVPNVNVKTAVTEMGFVKLSQTKGYDQWANPKKSNSQRHVYVSSKRFVDSISDANVAQEIAWGILTGGSTAEGSLEALKEQLVLEWADVLTWLAKTGEENGPELARDMVEEVFAFAKPLMEKKLNFDDAVAIFKPPKFSNLDLEIKLHRIEYKYLAKLPFEKHFKKILSLIGYNGRVPQKNITENHLGFSISIKKSKPIEPLQLVKKLVNLIEEGPQLDISTLAGGLSGGGDKSD